MKTNKNPMNHISAFVTEQIREYDREQLRERVRRGMKAKREKLINILISDKVNEYVFANCYDDLIRLLREGFDGFESYSFKELVIATEGIDLDKLILVSEENTDS